MKKTIIRGSFNRTLYFGKEAGGFIRAGTFIRIKKCMQIYHCFFAGNPLITKLMLEHGARKDPVNSVGRNAAQMAAFVGRCKNNNDGVNP